MTETLGLTLPQRPVAGYALLLVYATLLIYLLYRHRHSFRQLTRREWGGVLLLALLSLTVSQLFPIALTFERQLPPPGAAQNPRAMLMLFSAVPLLLAGASLNPLAALLVGFTSGLGRALWHTHQFYDPFYFAFAAVLASGLMQQNYRGRFYRWLRNPVASGLVSQAVLLPALGFAAFMYVSPETGNLVALDWALSTTFAQILPRLLEGAFGGLVVLLVFVGIPQWRSLPSTLVPAPSSRAVRTRLLLTFAAFAIPFSLSLLALVFVLSLNVATDLLVNQMAHNALTVSEQIPDFRNQVQNFLSQAGDDPLLLDDREEVVAQRLAQLVRTAGTYYRRVLLVSEAGEVVAFYPDRDVSTLSLTADELVSIDEALSRGAPSITAAQITPEGEHILSVVVPVVNEAGNPEAALVGRVPSIALNQLLAGLQGTVGEGSGFIVDEQGQVIAHPDETTLLTPWEPAPGRGRRFRSKSDLPGYGYEGRESETNARELTYLIEGPNHPWKVVLTVPYQVVLRLAVDISSPLVVMLTAGMLLFAGLLAYMGRSITRPLGKLVQASEELAAGRWDVSLPVEEENEVGRLGEAFDSMRRSMQRQFNDMRLLLDVTQDISTSIDIKQGMPSILRGAVRGTGAAGARAVVLNPSGRHPLFFHEGPAGKVMAGFDRRVTSLARRQRESILNSPEQLRAALGLVEDAKLPVRSLVALALYGQGRFQGVLWLGHRRPHNFAETELDLLRTIAGQAAVLIENARLFANAEGQRRRLFAVLSSTSDAVIVTDQTERVLLVNRAMELAFDLQPREVIGRAVADVIRNRRLVEALTEREDRVRDLEIPIADGRTLYANVSTIISNDGQKLGRVAVLHDITRLKELDEMKSEFVSTVSHDLRNPLTFMRGYISMLPMVGEINKKQEQYLEKILGGMEQMSSLIEDLLDLGRIEAGLDLIRDEIVPRILLMDVAAEYAEQASAQGNRLRVEADSDLPVVEGDVAVVRQAIANLVSNAIKYAPHSGTITLRAVADEGEMIFSVHDQGPGIPPEDQIRIFEKFYRVQEKGQDDTKGSGLGLAIVKSVAERHGGRAWVRSQLGEGSTFFFSLPLAEDS